MEPVTHLLTGACLARAGISRRVRYATFAMALAAEFPDIDTLWGLDGPIASFQHHRGITHTLLGVPLEAAFLLGAVALIHRWRVSRSALTARSTVTSATQAPAPTRWLALYGCLLLALLSHLLLDYTNNYGIRPFFPFNPRWYAASIVFIFDPLLFLFLLLGLMLPSLFHLVNREISSTQPVTRGVLWPRLALFAMTALWGIRALEHSKALDLARQQLFSFPATAPDDNIPSQSQTPQSLAGPPATPLLNARASLASPDPLSVFRWYTVSDFGPAYRLSVADTWSGNLAQGRTLLKPASSPALRAAQGSRLGRVYLDWSPMPWISVTPGSAQDAGSAPPEVSVWFEDPRFMGDTPFLRPRAVPPLSGSVTVDAHGRVQDEELNGKPDR